MAAVADAVAALLDLRSEKFKIGLKMARFPIGTILVLLAFELLVTPIFVTSFESNGLLVQEKKFKIDFQMTTMATILDFRSERF